MPTPSELVTDAFAQAQSYANTAQTQLTAFTAALNAAVQNAPLTSITFAPIADPGVSTVTPYVAPQEYSSGLTEALTTNLTTRLAGGTGIDPATEAAIWDRARERELATRQANIDQITRDSEALGWTLPPGVLFDAVARETRAYHDGAATASRDIAIKQAELEQANLQKSFDQAVAFEQFLADILAKRAQVSLDTFRADVERFVAEVSQDVKHWEAQIKQYEAQITYTMNSEKLNTEIIRGNLNASLDAAKVGAQVYAQLVASAYSLIRASASVNAGATNSVSYSYSNDTATAPASVTAV